jgi:hypothetical protein
MGIIFVLPMSLRFLRIVHNAIVDPYLENGISNGTGDIEINCNYSGTPKK